MKTLFRMVRGASSGIVSLDLSKSGYGVTGLKALCRCGSTLEEKRWYGLECHELSLILRWRWGIAFFFLSQAKRPTNDWLQYNWYLILLAESGHLPIPWVFNRYYLTALVPSPIDLIVS